MRQGSVVIGPDFFGGNSRRPFIVISNEKHPFHHEELLAVAVTTTEREEAIALREEKFKDGSLPRESYASPWTVTTLKHSSIQENIGQLKKPAVEEITGQVNKYIQV